MILFIISILLAILLHELGHLIMSILCGVRVEEFSIGFGKPSFGFTWKGIRWQVTPWLLGGYCKIYGEQEKVPNGLMVQPYLKKFAIVIAGVMVNFITAIICWFLNYQNIKIGLFVDWTAFQTIFTGDYIVLKQIFLTLQPNEFLFQLSLLSFSCAILNILPIPALDGGYIWLFAMEKIWKENYVKYLNIITGYFFWFLMIGQFVYIAYILL